MRFLRGLIGAILLVLLIVFAVGNRQTVTVFSDPLPFAIDLPVYLLVFLVFFAGLALGALAGRWSAWSAARRLRAKPPPAATGASSSTIAGKPPLPPPV